MEKYSRRKNVSHWKNDNEILNKLIYSHSGNAVEGSGASNEKQHIEDCMFGEIIAEFTRQPIKRDQQINDLKNRERERNGKR